MTAWSADPKKSGLSCACKWTDKIKHSRTNNLLYSLFYFQFQEYIYWSHSGQTTSGSVWRFQSQVLKSSQCKHTTSQSKQCSWAGDRPECEAKHCGYSPVIASSFHWREKKLNCHICNKTLTCCMHTLTQYTEQNTKIYAWEQLAEQSGSQLLVLSWQTHCPGFQICQPNTTATLNLSTHEYTSTSVWDTENVSLNATVMSICIAIIFSAV